MLAHMATTRKPKLGRPRTLDKAAPVTFYIPKSMRSEIADAAKTYRMSRSEMIRHAWNEWLAGTSLWECK
jgi:hypothetical protein